MRRPSTPSSALALVPFLLVMASCGGGDGGTDPITVESVVITAPAAPPSFQTLGRTVQFTASARDDANAPIAGATISWSTTASGVASVSAAGLVTAVANGNATITATSSGVTSTGVLVTVAQVIDTLNPTPATVAFGAVGSSRQLAAVAVDSSDAPVAGAAAATWVRAGSGTVATVSPTGLATAIGLGITDTAVATVGTKSVRIPISVTQVVAVVQVTPTAPDTLRTTTRTKQFTATPRDSQSNAMATAVTWSSSQPAVATVNGSGLATAVSDGDANIIATADGTAISGQRTLFIRRYAAVFTMTPSSASITTALGTQNFTGSAQDTLFNNLAIAWSSKNTAVLTVSPAAGTQTTASAVGNGSTYVVIAAGGRRDSATVTVTNQITVPLTADVNVETGAFQSARNGTSNPAIDTVAVGGTVTWTWQANVTHTIQPLGGGFSGVGNTSTGSHSSIFSNAGSFGYQCGIHPFMTGTIVAR